MPDHVDAYADQFLITVGPWGSSLSFMVSAAHPDPNKPTAPTPVATIRMSNEHVKAMVMIIKRHIMQIEGQLGVEARIPPAVLGQLGIAPEDWDLFWKKSP